MCIDVVNDYYSPRVSATELIITVARVRTKHFLPRLLGFVTEVMNRYMQSAPEQRNAREKDGALMVVGELVDEVKKVQSLLAVASCFCLSRHQSMRYINAVFV